MGTEGNLIQYDARQRRVAQQRNGATVKRWVYDGQYRVVAEVDAVGVVTSRFVYATQSHSPDYLVRGGVTYAYVKNHLGIIAMVVASGFGQNLRAYIDNLSLRTQGSRDPFDFAR